MDHALVLISIGNTRTRIAAVAGDTLEPSRVLTNDDPAAIAKAVITAAGESGKAIIATVNATLADALEKLLISGGVQPLRFGRDLAVPILHTLDESGANTVGQDRLLDALGAYARSQQACVVIDAGTAVTVDFVDGEGVFHGGAIAPGIHLMLRALHEHTSALPLIKMSRDLLPESQADTGKQPDRQGGLSDPGTEPDDDDLTDSDTDSDNDGDADEPDLDDTSEDQPSLPAPFGKNTRSAIAIGVASAVRGLAHELIDKYAAFYGAYPRVVATGGDAPLLFESDPLIEAIVPDLPLVGMLEAIKKLDRLDE